MKLAAYTRVSTVMQVAEGESLDVQEKQLREEATRRGWALEMYREEGVSAKDANRPQYRRMREDLQSGAVQGAIAIKLDRFWRSLPLAVSEIDQIVTKWGRTLLTLDGMVDYTTPEKRLQTNIMASLAQWQREVQGERVKGSLMQKAERGEFCGGKIPYGYGLPERKKPLVIHKEEASRVKQMFALYLKKRSFHGVVAEINKAGWRTRAWISKTGVKRGGAPWDVSSVKRILGNPVYQGHRTYNRHLKGRLRPVTEHLVVKNKVPPIVSPETWERVQELRREIKREYPTRRQRSSYLLSGLVYCEHCGVKMVGGINGRWKYYRCYAARHKGPTACPKMVWIRADKLEAEVVKRLFHFRVDAEALREKLQSAMQERRTELPTLKQRVGYWEGRLTQLAGRDEQIKDAYEDGEYSLQEMKVRRRQSEQEMKDAEHALSETRAETDRIESQSTDVERVVEALETAWGMYSKIDFEGRQQLIRTLIGRVVVQDERHAFFEVPHLDKIFQAPRTGEYHFELQPRPKVSGKKGQISAPSSHQSPRQDQPAQ